MSQPNKLALVREPGLEPEQVDTQAHEDFEEETCRQVDRARELLHMPAHAFLRWPWTAMNQMTGGLAPGSMTFVCARTGSGKSTLITSAIDRWLAEGRRIFHMPLETEPGEWRLRWAGHRVGYDAGNVIGGVAPFLPDWEHWQQVIDAELESQASPQALKDQGLWVDPCEDITAERLVDAFETAAEWEADVVIVDHIDQLEAPEGSSLFEESVRAVKRTHKTAKRTGMRGVLTSQLNRPPKNADRLAVYLPPTLSDVYMGEHKGHVASSMVGIFRPFRERNADEPIPPKGSGVPDRYVEAFRAARDGTSKPWTVLKENTMGLVNMKLRNAGKNPDGTHRHEGQRCELGVEHGRVVDLSPRDAHKTT